METKNDEIAFLKYKYEEIFTNEQRINWSKELQISVNDQSTYPRRIYFVGCP
jgi:hypothetical protein